VKLARLAKLWLAGCGGEVARCFSGRAVSAGYNAAQCAPQSAASKALVERYTDVIPAKAHYCPGNFLLPAAKLLRCLA